jgi:hypothetical protein
MSQQTCNSASIQPKSTNMNPRHFPDEPQPADPSQSNLIKNLTGIGKCDSCYTQSIRCRRGNVEDSKCENCIKSDYKCSYENHVEGADRGRERGSGHSENGLSSMDRQRRARRGMHVVNGNGNEESKEMADWRRENEELLVLVDVYFEVVYPL